MAVTVTVPDLHHRLAAAGVGVTPHQLKRLRREGLAARPDQKHKIGQAGSAVVYPEVAVIQLIRVLRLRKKQRYRTFRELRIGAWLERHPVSFGLLQPDVVACLRQALVGQQRLTIGSEDDQLERRLADTRVPRSSRMTAYERAISPASILDVLLTVLQLAVDTSHSVAAAETFDVAFSYDNQDALSDVYSDWELPGTPKWPRIVSRVSRKWFVVGPEWVKGVTTVLIHHRQVLDDLSPSPATSLALTDLRHQLSDLSPAGLEARTLIACQGIVLGKTQPDLALRVFDPSD